ncbi:hypothetical protein B0H63DRAFT_282318 [Podospora didyma]|uniref:Elongator complex protein 6 n=1 Tax=Podospora didyma TaxID=330526 RepID=A0AAE0K826_9PEZI|nr:hypothetical protein B0H63DRAFT_282318 [Podospora didyma]
MTSRISPPLLEPYLGLPDEAGLLVLTGILGASTNWLVLRYLHSFLKPATTTKTRSTLLAQDDDASSADDNDEVCVVLVSFLRDLSFWRDAAGRLGVDLDLLARRDRFAFVDGLSGLFSPSPVATAGVLTIESVADVGTYIQRAVDALQRQQHPHRRAAPPAGGGDDGSSIPKKEKKIVLVVDQLDFLLAATAGTMVTGLALRELLLDLREKVYATITTLSADEPLVVTQTTALEKEHASFVLSLAHEAATILSLRLLDTGVAKDVSGVIRITAGGDVAGKRIDEKEFLYHVGGDGGVRVFERGQ